MNTTIPSEPHTCQPNAIMQLSACGYALRAACINALTAMTDLTGARKQQGEEYEVRGPGWASPKKPIPARCCKKGGPTRPMNCSGAAT